jgi:LmbE family N-acetylglucosaminyl deacetylase
MPRMSATPRRTLLVAFAHPDDETHYAGGVMARAVDEGHRVVVVCATRGETGNMGNPPLATRETLGQVREQELRAAAAALGVSDVRFLGFRCSGTVGSPENHNPLALINADPDEVVRRLVREIRDARPDVLVTFEPGGVYGHPDHMAMSTYGTAAAVAAGSPDRWSDIGRAHRVARVYHAAVPRSEMVEWRAQALAAGIPWKWDPDQLKTVADEAITSTFDVTPWLERKKVAIAAHATQFGNAAKIPPSLRTRMISREWFVLVDGDPVGQLVAGL